MEPPIRYSRDPDYYIDDGNVILLVESTLFKVHRSTLMRDHSVFHEMFSTQTKQDDNEAISDYEQCESLSGVNDGQDDDNPIRLPEDTVSQFRALLWSLYALPLELVSAAQNQAEVERFIDIAAISHKYQFVSMEQWSLDTLVSFHTTQNPERGPDTLSRLTGVSVLCDHTQLLDIVLAQWKRFIGEGRQLQCAIEVSERHGLTDLLALAYLAMLRKGRDEWPQDQKHVIRLLNGFYNLVRECSVLPSRPPHFEHFATCSEARCGETWRRAWKRVINEINSGKLGKATQLSCYDLLGKLMVAQSFIQALVEETIPENRSIDNMPEECRHLALDATKARVKAVQTNLNAYFSDL